MKMVTSELMRKIDSKAINESNIPSIELMENAGRGIAQAIVSDIVLDYENAKFSIFCGKGNNGGDGFVIGRHLFLAGYEVEFFYLGPIEKQSEDCRINFDSIQKLDLVTTEINSVDNLPDILDSDFIIDAIFGTGFKDAPQGIAAELIAYINEQPQEIISVDMPSGLNADNGQCEGEVIIADYTYTLAQPKYGLFISPGREIAGNVDIIPIGIPNDVVDSFSIHNHLITPSYVQDKIPYRFPEGHKGTFGKLFILAGSTGMTGAAVLAGKSAYRSGCGLVKIGCPMTTLPTIASSLPDATTHPLPDVAKKGKLALRGLGEIRKIISEHDAVVIGPGIGLHHETKELVCRLLLSIEKPAIVDADALNALNGELSILEDAKAEIIITPHPGEFERLTGEKVEDDFFKKIEQVRKFAIEYQTTIVLKGSPTVVGDIDGNVYINQTGNNGMAVGGSGDVLSGMIGSFIAQGMEPIDSALCGVFMHGLAGDIGADELGEHSLIASDIVEYIPVVFNIF